MKLNPIKEDQKLKFHKLYQQLKIFFLITIGLIFSFSFNQITVAQTSQKTDLIYEQIKAEEDSFDASQWNRSLEPYLQKKDQKPIQPGTNKIHRGIIYSQPSYYHYYLLDADLESFRQDFSELRKLVDVVGIWIDWDDIMSEWDINKEKPVWNRKTEEKLSKIIDIAQENGLKVTFLIQLNFNQPKGIPGSVWLKQWTDEAGITHIGRWGRAWDVMINPKSKKPLLLFHEELGRLMKDKPNILDYTHTYETLYLALPWGRDMKQSISAWHRYLRDINPDLNYWNQRWGENNKNWSVVEIPSAAKGLWWDSYWKNKAKQGVQPVNSSKKKWGDFYNFMTIGILKEGKYGVSLQEISGALKKYDTDAVFTFKHLQPWRLRNRGMSDADIKLAYQVADVATLGYYPQQEQDLNGEKLRTYIRDVKSLTSNPIYLWETGLPTESKVELALSEREQRQWVNVVDKIIQEEGVLGYNIWLYTDLYLQYPQNNSQYGLRRIDGVPKPALELLFELSNPK